MADWAHLAAVTNTLRLRAGAGAGAGGGGGGGGGGGTFMQPGGGTARNAHYLTKWPTI
jgi:hypothetical protein